MKIRNMGDKNQEPASLLSRLFNNSGNKMDPSRVRLIDGTPIHSTGIHRLSKCFDIQAAMLGSVTGGAMTDAPVPVSLFLMLLSGTFLAGSRWLSHVRLRKAFGKDFGDLCINKAPDKNTTPTSPTYLATADIMEFSYKADIVLDSGFALFVSPYLIPGTITHDALQARAFSRVVAQQWILEDTPPPLKQDIKVREPSFDVAPMPA